MPLLSALGCKSPDPFDSLPRQRAAAQDPDSALNKLYARRLAEGSSRPSSPPPAPSPSAADEHGRRRPQSPLRRPLSPTGRPRMSAEDGRRRDGVRAPPPSASPPPDLKPTPVSSHPSSPKKAHAILTSGAGTEAGKKRKGPIDKSMIGKPTNFQHTAHIGAGDVTTGPGARLVHDVDSEQVKAQLADIAAALASDTTSNGSVDTVIRSDNTPVRAVSPLSSRGCPAPQPSSPPPRPASPNAIQAPVPVRPPSQIRSASPLRSRAGSPSPSVRSGIGSRPSSPVRKPVPKYSDLANEADAGSGVHFGSSTTSPRPSPPRNTEDGSQRPSSPIDRASSPTGRTRFATERRPASPAGPRPARTSLGSRSSSPTGRRPLPVPEGFRATSARPGVPEEGGAPGPLPSGMERQTDIRQFSTERIRPASPVLSLVDEAQRSVSPTKRPSSPFGDALENGRSVRIDVGALERVASRPSSPVNGRPTSPVRGASTVAHRRSSSPNGWRYDSSSPPTSAPVPTTTTSDLARLERVASNSSLVSASSARSAATVSSRPVVVRRPLSPTVAAAAAASADGRPSSPTGRRFGTVTEAFYDPAVDGIPKRPSSPGKFFRPGSPLGNNGKPRSSSPSPPPPSSYYYNNRGAKAHPADYAGGPERREWMRSSSLSSSSSGAGTTARASSVSGSIRSLFRPSSPPVRRAISPLHRVEGWAKEEEGWQGAVVVGSSIRRPNSPGVGVGVGVGAGTIRRKAVPSPPPPPPLWLPETEREGERTARTYGHHAAGSDSRSRSPSPWRPASPGGEGRRRKPVPRYEEEGEATGKDRPGDGDGDDRREEEAPSPSPSPSPSSSSAVAVGDSAALPAGLSASEILKMQAETRARKANILASGSYMTDTANVRWGDALKEIARALKEPPTAEGLAEEEEAEREGK